MRVVSNWPNALKILVFHAGTDKATGECPVQQLFGQLERKLLEVDEIDGMGDDVPRLAAAKLLCGRLVVLSDESVERGLRESHALRRAKAPEDLHEFLSKRVAEKHLVLDAAQEGFVAEALGLKGGREDQEGLEGHFHLPARVEAKVIHATVHRNDPTVQHLRRTGLLPAKVVDEVN